MSIDNFFLSTSIDTTYQLPRKMNGHSMQQIDANTLLLAGGWRNTGPKNEFIYTFDRTNGRKPPFA